MNSRKKMISRQTELVKNGNPAEPGKEDESSSAGLAIQGWKKWFLRGCLAILTPCIFLLLLEGGLRLAGYGYPSSCFLKKEAGGRTFFIENSKFELRFFPPALLRIPSSYTIPDHKDSNTYRIFVIGSSVAAGFPQPAYGFSRILEVILKAKHPERNFEIVNTATTAINSHVDLPIVEEAAKHQPNLFIIYDGHNEVLGPFGPETVFVPYSRNLAVIRSAIFVKSTRIGQLLNNARLLVTKEKVPLEWHGMEMVIGNRLLRDDPRLQVVYSHFKSNLTDMCQAASRSGAKVVFATLGTNLKDSAPFASVHRANLTEEQRRQWEQLYQRGVDAELEKKYAKARDFYLAAARIDDQFADLQFRLARSYLSLQDYASASQHYVEARDDDALRFRADSQINQVIRDVAASQQANGVSLVDMEKIIPARSAQGVPGADFFYDHVHFNFDGNYLLAEKIGEQIDLLLSGSVKDSISEAECAKRLAFTDWDQGQIAKDLLPMLRQVPFTSQLNHDEQISRLKQRMQELLAKGPPEVVSSSRLMYEQALRGVENDWMLRNQYGILLADTGDAAKAAEQFRQVLSLLPFRSWPHVALAQALAKSGDPEAKKEYQEALRLDPDSRNAHLGLGALFLAEDNPTQASIQYQAALSMNPEDAKALVGEGYVWFMQGKDTQAAETYEHALRNSPSMIEAHYRLGELLLRQGATEKAVSQLREAVQLDFAYVDAHVKLGEAYEAQSEPELALEQYITAAAVDPDQLQRYYGLVANLLNRTGRHGAAELALGDAFSTQHKWNEAAAHYAEAVRTTPEVAEFHLRLATALHNLGRDSQARAELSTALRLDPSVTRKTRSERPN
jgi:tetratricopeptide (TPR) repeat protein